MSLGATPLGDAFNYSKVGLQQEDLIMETALIDFKEIAEKNSYDIPKIDDSILDGVLPFENIDKAKIKQSQSRQKLLDFKLIDLECLSWTDKNGYPRMAVFNTSQKLCSYTGVIDCASQKIDFYVPITANAAWKHTKSIMKELLKKAVNNTDVNNVKSVKFYLSSKFNGIVPKEVRNMISLHQSKFDEIAIIAEADNWTYNEEVTHYPPNPDPLVVGFKDDLAYLICTFDVTKLEHYIKSEFVE